MLYISPVDIEKKLEAKGLVNICKINRTIKINLRYATTNNFTKKKLYSQPLCFLREEVAYKLSLVQKELNNENLTLIVWDAYRPKRIQKFIWEAFPNPQYNTKISSHNKGIAVDLTLGDKSGNTLPMPTDFDVFGKESHHGYNNFPENIIKNRERLKSAMEKHGFNSFKHEWWHYAYLKLRDSEIIDIPL